MAKGKKPPKKKGDEPQVVNKVFAEEIRWGDPAGAQPPTHAGGGRPGSGGGPRHGAGEPGEATLPPAWSIRTGRGLPPPRRRDAMEQGPPYAGPAGGAVGGTPPAAGVRRKNAPRHHPTRRPPRRQHRRRRPHRRRRLNRRGRAAIPGPPRAPVAAIFPCEKIPQGAPTWPSKNTGTSATSARPASRRRASAGPPPADLRRPGTPRLAPALRLPPRGRRRPEKLGRPQGAVAGPRTEAPRRPGRGPPALLRLVRGDHSEGQYGAGTVRVWDHGTYETEPEGENFDKEMAAGRIEFTLHGERLKGRFLLLRMRGKMARRGGKEQWLLIRAATATPTRSGRARTGENENHPDREAAPTWGGRAGSGPRRPRVYAPR